MQVGSVNVIPQSANHMIVSLNSCIQKPNSSFTVSGSTITFSSNLVTGDVIDFIQILGDVLDLGVPSDATVTTAKVADGAITSAKLASGVGGVAGISSSADATAMTITSAEKIGIGETTPLVLVHIKQADSGQGTVSENTSQLIIEDDSTAGITLLGGTSGTGAIFFGDSGDNDIGLIEYDHGANAMVFKTNASEQMRIDSSGRLLIGTTSAFNSNGSAVHVNVDTTGAGQGAMMTECASTSTTFHQHFRNGNGGVGGISTNASATQYVTSSDYRLKENVNYDFDATSRLKELKPARFNFKVDADTTVDGFLAHEVSSIVPEAISGEKDAVNEDGSIIAQGIDQSKLVPLLVKTIQELEARITELENA